MQVLALNQVGYKNDVCVADRGSHAAHNVWVLHFPAYRIAGKFGEN